MKLLFVLLVILLSTPVTLKHDEDYKDDLRFLREEEINVEDEGQYTNVFAVQFKGPEKEIKKLADQHGFKIAGKLDFEDLPVYELHHKDVDHRSKRSADNHISLLNAHPQVDSVDQQKLLIRVKRDGIGGFADGDGFVLGEEPVDKQNIADPEENLITHDKQKDFHIDHIGDNRIYQRFYKNDVNLITRDGIPQPATNIMKFNDPLFSDQWYLNNELQAGGRAKQDMDVIGAWKKGFTGHGVHLNVLDDGIQHDHPDLKDNYSAEISGDFNDNDHDPTPNILKPGNSHGTRCAGEIASCANNSVCGVGIAYNSKIGGIRILDGKVFDSMEGRALLHKNQIVDITSASWGPRDNGQTMERPHKHTQKALEEGVKKGRGGKGTIFVWATGNGGGIGDDCGADGYVSSPYTLSVGSINQYGESTYYTEKCPSTIAMVYVGGAHSMTDIRPKHPLLKVVTTDVFYHKDDEGCMENFQGTSAASPMAAGCIALALEANMDMTWRDVQHVIIRTTRIPNPKEPGWTINGAGHHVNDAFGFGAMDCSRMVDLAQSWKTVPPQTICLTTTKDENVTIPVNGKIEVEMQVDGCQRNDTSRVDKLEHTEVKVHIIHPRRGDLKLILISPAGTLSEVLSYRPRDNNKNIDFTFMTVHNWDENPVGKWIFRVEDRSTKDRKISGTIVKWSIKLYGTRDSGETHRAQNPDKSKLLKIISAEEDQRLKANNDIVKKGDTIGLVKKKQEKELDDTMNKVIKKLHQGLIQKKQLQTVLSKLSPGARNLFRRKLEDIEYMEGRKLVQPDPQSKSEFKPHAGDSYIAAGGGGSEEQKEDARNLEKESDTNTAEQDKELLKSLEKRLFDKKSSTSSDEQLSPLDEKRRELEEIEKLWDNIE